MDDDDDDERTLKMLLMENLVSGVRVLFAYVQASNRFSPSI